MYHFDITINIAVKRLFVFIFFVTFYVIDVFDLFNIFLL